MNPLKQLTYVLVGLVMLMILGASEGYDMRPSGIMEKLGKMVNFGVTQFYQNRVHAQAMQNRTRAEKFADRAMESAANPSDEIAPFCFTSHTGNAIEALGEQGDWAGVRDYIILTERLNPNSPTDRADCWKIAHAAYEQR